MKTLLRSFWTLVLLAAIGGGLVWSFWPQPLDVEVARVGRGELEVTVDEDGKTRIKERYIVSTPVAGRLLRIDLDPGDPVRAGETLLATIEPNEPDFLDARALAQAEAKVKAAEAVLARVDPALARARVELDHAERELRRVQQLVATQAVSKEDIDTAEMVYHSREQDFRSAKFAEDVARFELEMARAALVQARPASADEAGSNSHFLIKSPISGRLLRKFHESATVVAAGAQLVELGDPADLEVVVDVLSSDAVRIQPGAKAYLEQWGGTRLAATVRLIEPSAFLKISALGVEEQRVNVILDLNEPPERRGTLGDGFRVEARIVVCKLPDALQAPTGALFRSHNEWSAFVVAGGRAVLRTVAIGERNSDAAEVLKGLAAGDEVILHPSDKVEDQIRVRKRDLSSG